MADNSPCKQSEIYQIIELTISRSNVGEINTLQKSAYRVEAAITGINNIPNLMERDEQLLESNEQFLGCFASKKLVGILSFQEISKQKYQICRVAVDPENFGKGIGFKLINKVISLCSPGALVVTTGKGNIPARKLYEKAGFKYEGELKVKEDITMWSFLLNQKARKTEKSK